MTGTLRILHLLACILAVGTTPARAQPKATMLAVASAGPRGEIGSLAEANEVRVVFSEPMVSLGRIPAGETAPFLRISPAVAGTFRWSGTTTLIFTPDPKHPLPFATRYEVTIAPSATAVSGRRLAEPYTFSFTTPTTRLLNTIWARRGGRADAPGSAAPIQSARQARRCPHTPPRGVRAARLGGADLVRRVGRRHDGCGSRGRCAVQGQGRRHTGRRHRNRTSRIPADRRLGQEGDASLTGSRRNREHDTDCVRELGQARARRTSALARWSSGARDDAGVHGPGGARIIRPELRLRDTCSCLRRRVDAGVRAARRALPLPHRRGWRALQPAQLRWTLPRSPPGASRAGRIRERAGCRARVARRRPTAAALPHSRRLLDVRTERIGVRPRCDPGQRGGPARRAGGRLRRVCARRRWLEPTWRRTQSDAQAAERPLVSPRTAFWITDILSDADAREYIFGRGGHLQFPFAVAVKTGTSQAYHDNWTIGYTREVTVGVWVGNFDRAPLRTSTGVTGAAPIFHAVMLAAAARVPPAAALMESRPILARPDGLLERDVCALSGMPASEWCPSRQREWLPPGGETPCSWHQLGDRGPLVEWPPAYRAWAAQHGLAADRSRARVASARARAPGARQDGPAITITNPPSGATYSIDPTLRREFQALALRAVTAGTSRVEWHVDDERLGSASSDASLMWPLRPGTHRILARDQQGRTAESTILVR